MAACSRDFIFNIDSDKTAIIFTTSNQPIINLSELSKAKMLPWASCDSQPVPWRSDLYTRELLGLASPLLLGS